MLQIKEKEGLFQFCHEAMATELVLALGGCDEAYARGAAQAFFARVDAVESKLSLYQETSDVTRINLLKQGEQTAVSEECIECLQLAMLASELSKGHFHPFLGGDSLKVKGEVPGYLRPVLRNEFTDVSKPAVQIDPVGRQLQKLAEGLVLDLGGVGKGYALDLAMEEMEDWEIPLAMANFGGSTLLFRSFGTVSPWMASLGGRELEPFSEGAFSSSGLGFQGEHIVSVRGGVLHWERCFARASSAGLADALTTGGMLMSADELEELCVRREELVLAASSGGDVWGGERFCRWNGE